MLAEAGLLDESDLNFEVKIRSGDISGAVEAFEAKVKAGKGMYNKNYLTSKVRFTTEIQLAFFG